MESGWLGWAGVGRRGLARRQPSSGSWPAMQPPGGMDHGRNKASRASSSAAQYDGGSLAADHLAPFDGIGGTLQRRGGIDVDDRAEHNQHGRDAVVGTVKPVPASTGSEQGVSMRRLQSGREGNTTEHTKFRVRICRMSSASGGAKCSGPAIDGRYSDGSRIHVQLLARLRHVLMENWRAHQCKSRLESGPKNSMSWYVQRADHAPRRDQSATLKFHRVIRIKNVVPCP